MPATIRPVIGPATMPVWPWPNASHRFSWRGEGPITGSPSGMLGRWPIHCVAPSSRSFGYMHLASRRMTSARRGFAGASTPAISTMPAKRTPIAIGFATNLQSASITVCATVMPGSGKVT